MLWRMITCEWSNNVNISKKFDYFGTLEKDCSMTYSDIDTVTLDAPAVEVGEWGAPVTARLSNRKAWEEGLIQVTPNLDLENSYWLHFFAQKREWFSLLVLDASGNTVMQREKRSREGHNLVSLDASSLVKGIYQLRILTDGRVLSGSLKV